MDIIYAAAPFFSSSPSFSFPIHLDSADQTEFLPACFNWKEGVCYVTESRATPQKPRTRDVASDSAFTVAIIARRNEFFLSFFFVSFSLYVVRERESSEGIGGFFGMLIRSSQLLLL